MSHPNHAMTALQPAIDRAISFLAAHGISSAPGLSDQELRAVEDRFAFRFPPDLRAFLQFALPLGDGTSARFPNWRSDDPARLQDRLDFPSDGIAFDIEHNAFWWSAWSPKPQHLPDALATARQHLAATPRLIPIYSHRYIPAEPSLPGNPIFSIHQTDIILYGVDLWDYFAHEFGPAPHLHPSSTNDVAPHRPIPFWTDLLHWNNNLL